MGRDCVWSQGKQGCDNDDGGNDKRLRRGYLERALSGGNGKGRHLQLVGNNETCSAKERSRRCVIKGGGYAVCDVGSQDR